MKTKLKLLLILFALSFYSEAISEQNQIVENVETYKKEDNDKSQFIKVAILLDTSNSMDGLIDQAKAQLWEIVNELSYAKCVHDKPNLQIAIYEYGNDHLNADEGYVRQVLAFSEDLDEISKELFSLTTNGGSEYCGKVIQTSLNQLKWGSDPDDLKLIFIAGNEPFTQGKVRYKDAVTNAKEKDITVNTIFCGDYNIGISTYWKDGADLTNGDYISINQNKKTIHIASPYDTEILNLNIKLNRTYVAYGDTGKKKLEIQKEQDDNAKGYSTANAVSRTVSKSSHLYKNHSWDLVDAYVEDAFKVSEIEKESLPVELKNKSENEIKTYLDNKLKERKAIQGQIQELNAKRKAFVSKQEKNNDLENAMINAIKSQAKKKNYKWD